MRDVIRGWFEQRGLIPHRLPIPSQLAQGYDSTHLSPSHFLIRDDRIDFQSRWLVPVECHGPADRCRVCSPCNAFPSLLRDVIEASPVFYLSLLSLVILLNNRTLNQKWQLSVIRADTGMPEEG